MQDIIKVTKNEIGNTELNSVNAREIHSYLEVKTHLSTWIQRAISKYDFKENIDFSILKSGNPNGGRDVLDYIVTIDMAKELAMLENNPKGREVRKCFIQIEKEHINYLENRSELSIDNNSYKTKYLEVLERENKLLRDMFYQNSILSIEPAISGTKFSEEEIKTIKELHKKRYSVRQIAKAINRSSSGVQNFISRLNKEKK
ncbi:antA/AntB antirepressor family protein [Aliarcobacter lanthieri]|uniref:antA/AntB antirepressor family protein n=1 Tax=Aliarcobacter lanthieri TaxID=1355374 RepID=UPI003AAC5C76